jgi:flagellar biosynthesis/type III secretory pathway chaperone
MSAPTIVSPSPQSVFGPEKIALDLLLALLTREHDALMGRDPHLIAAIAHEKQLLLDQLGLLIKARTSRGQPRSRPAAAAATDPALRSLWKKVEAQNRINASVLALHAAVVARALGVLRHAVGNEGHYNARGKLAGHYLAAH